MKRSLLKTAIIISMGSLILFSAGCASGKKKKDKEEDKEESGILGPLKSIFEKNKDK